MIMLRIKELREEKNLSQEQVAKEIGINFRTIGNYECGRREPSIDIIEKLCIYFGVSAGYLLGIED